MPTINLGVDFSDVENEDTFPVLPNGTYPFKTTKVEGANSKSSDPPGRPMIKWTFTTVQDGIDFNNFHYTVLPWEVDGEWIASGVGMLVTVCKALGKPWTGKNLVTEDYLGVSGTYVLEQALRQKQAPDGSWVDDPNGAPVNVIKSFVIA